MSTTSEYTLDARRSDGSIDIERLAGILYVTEAELVSSIGPSGDTGERKSWLDSPQGQSGLNWLAELLERVTPWAGDPRAAYAWYCSQPIAGCGGQTAQDLFKAGRSSAVDAYLNRIAHGGHA